jgi:hypothetical protein
VLCVIYKTGSWIGWLDLLTPYTQHSGLQAIQRYCWSTHFTVHRCTRSILSLYYSYPGNGFVSLTVTSNHTWSLLITVWFLSCQYSAAANFEDSTQFKSKFISWQAGLPKLDCSVEFFCMTTLHGRHGKHRLLLSRIILGVFTAPLHSNGRGADHVGNSTSVVEACLPSRCLAMGMHVTTCTLRDFLTKLQPLEMSALAVSPWATTAFRRPVGWNFRRLPQRHCSHAPVPVNI